MPHRDPLPVPPAPTGSAPQVGPDLGQGAGFDRREFCACALALAAAAAAASACGGGGGGGGGAAAPPPPPSGPVTTTELKASFLAMPAGTVRDYTTTASGACPLVLGAAQGYYLVRDSGGIYAISASCLHQGGRISPNGGSGFTCPCHGSQYDLNGTATVGPAPVGSILQHFQVSESSPGGALVIDPSKPVSASVRLT